jgi:hypothetical protein
MSMTLIVAKSITPEVCLLICYLSLLFVHVASNVLALFLVPLFAFWKTSLAQPHNY